MDKEPSNKPLPQFRHDLELYDGPEEPDGSPTYNLYDPIKSQYYKLTWLQYQIIINLTPEITLSELLKKIKQKTTAEITEEQIRFFFNHAASIGILSLPKSAEQVEKEASVGKVGAFKWLLTHYLYFRIPLVNPDKFLEKTLPYVRFLVKPPAVILYLIIIFLGVAQVLSRFDEFIHTFTYFYSFKGIVIFSVAITGIKIIHELGHAYTAKNYGVNVNRMGVAFLILWPVMYTDVTDGWKLPKRSQRFAISAAGIVVELVIAGLCSFLWALSSPGLAQSVFFVISSITWISTLLVNVNPAMRFDGYYLLSDLWGVDNLQSRAFAITRWKIRYWLFGLDMPPPEEDLSEKRIIGMVIYSIITWIYRIFLYLSIALFVYGYFTKTLGIFLFFMEIGVFLVWPIASEISHIISLRNSLKFNFRILFSLLGLVLLTVWFTVPFAHKEYFVAVTTPPDEQTIYVPHNGKISKLYVERGDKVEKEQPLVKLVSEDLVNEIKSLYIQKKIIEQQIRIITFREEQNDHEAYLPEKEAELEGVNEQLRGLLALNENMTLCAQLQGIVYSWDEDLYVNQPVAKDQILGKIADMEIMHIYAYIPEDLIDIVTRKQDVTFLLSSNYETFEGKVLQISPSRAETLSHMQLASINGGELPVTEGEDGKMNLVDTFYIAEVALNDPDELPEGYGEIGYVEIKGPKRSLFMRLWNDLQNLFWRESGV